MRATFARLAAAALVAAAAGTGALAPAPAQAAACGSGHGRDRRRGPAPAGRRGPGGLRPGRCREVRRLAVHRQRLRPHLRPAAARLRLPHQRRAQQRPLRQHLARRRLLGPVLVRRHVGDLELRQRGRRVAVGARRRLRRLLVAGQHLQVAAGDEPQDPCLGLAQPVALGDADAPPVPERLGRRRRRARRRPPAVRRRSASASPSARRLREGPPARRRHAACDGAGPAPSPTPTAGEEPAARAEATESGDGLPGWVVPGVLAGLVAAAGGAAFVRRTRGAPPP